MPKSKTNSVVPVAFLVQHSHWWRVHTDDEYYDTLNITFVASACVLLNKYYFHDIPLKCSDAKSLISEAMATHVLRRAWCQFAPFCCQLSPQVSPRPPSLSPRLPRCRTSPWGVVRLAPQHLSSLGPRTTDSRSPTTGSKWGETAIWRSRWAPRLVTSVWYVVKSISGSLVLKGCYKKSLA